MRLSGFNTESEKPEMLPDPVQPLPAAGAAPGDLDSIRFVTILFADIVGSTRLIASLEPDDARDLLDASILLIQQAIHELGGLVVRVQGDGVMAVFGVQPAAEDHALRGALAGLRINELMKSGIMGILPAPQVRVGVHSGPVLLRQQDNDFGRILDVVGHAAHVAGQTEKIAKPGGVAISATALSLIAEPCAVEPAGTVASGADERGEAVFALAAINLDGSDSLPVKGNATVPLIGRTAELAMVHAEVRRLALREPDATEAHDCRALGIIGEAGIGKSRLLLEAARLGAGLGVTFVAVRGSALMAAVPFGCLGAPLRLLIDLLRPFAPDPAAAAQMSDQESACLDGLLGKTDAWLAHLTPDDRNHIATQTVLRLARLAARHIRVLLLVDDVQYIDSESMSALAAICHDLASPAEQGPMPGLALILAGRPEAMPKLQAMCRTVITLGPLSPPSARTLVSLINRLAPLDDGTMERIIERAEGLPLALHEFAMTAQDSGLSAHERTLDPVNDQLPVRLDALLAARLAALDVDSNRLCQFCAALGPVFALQRLEKGAALVCRNPAGAIARLIEARVIEFAGTGQARFTHQLVQEAAYRAMARKRRRAMHARVLEMLQAGMADAQDALAPTHAELATHAEKAGLFEQALGHLWNACTQALGLAAIEAVQELHDRARSIAELLPPEAAPAARARFGLLVFDTLQQLSLEQSLRAEMLALAEGAIDLGPGARTVARINMALIEWIDGAPTRGSRWLAQAEADLDAHESLPRRTYADLVGAYLAYSLGQTREAVDRIERLGNRLDDGLRGATFGAVVVIPHVLARAFGAWYLTDLGETSKARSWIAEALNLSRRYRHAYSRLLADLARGYLHYRAGRLCKALPILRAAYADCLRHRFHGFEPASASWLALCLIDLGLLDEAQTIVEETVARGHFLKVRTSATYYLHEARCRLALAQGDAASAEALAGVALDHARACEDVVHELHALVLCAEVRAKTGRTVAAAGMTDPAMLATRARQLGLAGLAVAVERLGLGVAAVPVEGTGKR
ncbi:MAG: adenylate/guanylate cyclase domain-containing protein [Novosphingobium meiothermophilum]